MYGQNLGGRPDAHGEPIFTKFCMLVRVPDVFLSFEFQKDGWKMWELWGVEISPLPLTRHIAYTTACCYRTSRDYFYSALMLLVGRHEGIQPVKTCLHCVAIYLSYSGYMYVLMIIITKRRSWECISVKWIINCSWKHARQIWHK